MQCDVAQWLPTHIRQPFLSYVIDLTIDPDQLLSNYAYEVRMKIRKARQLGIYIARDKDPSEVIRIFQAIAEVKNLNRINAATFSTKPNLFVARAISPIHGVLAAHAYSLDKETGKVRLLYNASDFRSYEPGSPGRREAGIANVLLFHESFLYFRSVGFHIYDFGGYGTPASGSTFKDQFRGQVVKQYNYYPWWYFVLRKLRKWVS